MGYDYNMHGDVNVSPILRVKIQGKRLYLKQVKERIEFHNKQRPELHCDFAILNRKLRMHSGLASLNLIPFSLFMCHKHYGR